MTLPIIGFAGMTHLGLISGVCAAEKGFKIICFDENEELIANLNTGKIPVSEPGLDQIVKKNETQILFTSDESELAKCDVVYVAPDIPTDDSGKSDLSTIDKLLNVVFDATGIQTTVVVLSQVPPGFSRRHARAGRTYYYQVETLIFGRAVERAMYPERYIVGCDKPDGALSEAYENFLNAHKCPILKMRYESAELAKISINMCLVASVSVANTLAEISEVTGADWAEIVPALKLDKRIGAYAYLTPGLGISGGNLERDMATVCAIADRSGADAGVVRAWAANSAYRKEWVWRILQQEVLAHLPEAKIAVLGLAYKEDTHSIKNSPSLALLRHLNGRVVVMHDPVVDAAEIGLPFIQVRDPLAAIDGADVVCIMTPWSVYRNLDVQDLVDRMRGRWIIDPYRILNTKTAQQLGMLHHTLGVSNI